MTQNVTLCISESVLSVHQCYNSSVECGERGQRYFRFALRSPGEALLVKKGGVLGCFWGFSAPRKAGRLGKWRKNKRAANQRPSLAQT